MRAQPQGGTARGGTAPGETRGRFGNVPSWQLWLGLLAAPLMWLVQLDLGLAFGSVACGGSRVPLDTLMLLSVLVGLASWLTALRLRGASGQPPGVIARVTDYLGRFGAWHSGLFLLLIVLTDIASLFLQACPLS